MNKNSIEFTGYRINKFLLEKFDNIPDENKKHFNLEFNSYQNTEKGKENSYMISMNIITYTNQSKLDLTFDGFFEIPNNVNKETKEYFLSVSAPAILYPYIRTFISNVTSFDIDETVILPIINFAELPSSIKK